MEQKEQLIFQSLSSGSSGNCYYLGTYKSGILIDAGIGGRAIKQYLELSQLSLDQISGVLITHNHTDHIRGIYTLMRRYHIPVYTSSVVWKNIQKSLKTKQIPPDCIRIIEPGSPFNINSCLITAFNVSHDTPETLGYYIENKDSRITVVTDLGYICNSAASYIMKANFLVIESNYDRQMLLNGRYPHYLKQRILSNAGHLDNNETAEFIAKNMNEELTHICLAHLSKDNNTHELAMEAMQRAFAKEGLFLKSSPEVYVLERSKPSPIFSLKY